MAQRPKLHQMYVRGHCSAFQIVVQLARLGATGVLRVQHYNR